MPKVKVTGSKKEYRHGEKKLAFTEGVV